MGVTHGQSASHGHAATHGQSASHGHAATHVHAATHGHWATLKKHNQKMKWILEIKPTFHFPFTTNQYEILPRICPSTIRVR